MNLTQRLHFLNPYREQLKEELEKMRYGQAAHSTPDKSVEASDRLSSIIAILAMTLIFTSIFIVQ